MALFDKLFSLKRRLDSDKSETRDRCRSCQINPEQVRLLLFKECDWRGRRLLFDSSAITKVPANKNDKPNSRQNDEVPCIVEVSNGYAYMYKGPETDASVLGEMIFGAVAMNYKSVSLKIHIMDEPRRLMCTKVFCVPSNRRVSRIERKTSDRTDCSLNVRSPSTPLNVPTLREEGVSLSFSIDRGDSGFCGDNSPYSSVGSTYDYFSMFETWDGSTSTEDLYSFHSLPGRKLSTSSNGSWQRRTFQNIATRFSLGQSSQMLHVPTAGSNTSDSQLYSNSSTSGTSDSISSAVSTSQRKNKLGLAVLITVNDSAELDLVRKCVEHSPQIQSLLCRLRLATIEAGASGSFVSTLHCATENAARWLSDLIYGPRIQPMWLNIVSNPSNQLADSLIGDLCSILAVGDTKTTNFFISTLLTHVLTYHLGWVTAVSPYDTIDHQNVQEMETKRPYNALWAQLSDLCGSIGFPPRAARTIISGEKNPSFLNRLLVVLTYFVRCGDVMRTHYPPQHTVPKQSRTVLVKQALKSRVNEESKTPVNTQNSDSSVSTLVSSDVCMKRCSTLGTLNPMLSNGSVQGGSGSGSSMLRRNPTLLLSMKASSDSSLTSTVSEDSEPERKVVFVLGDDERLVGLKNKSTDGKSVKKSYKVINKPLHTNEAEKRECDELCVRVYSANPSKCCGKTIKHSKPIKHSGFKFEFDKYPQIVTNYMKSKNLEILDRHYIGKPGNLKLDNFQFDPTVVPPIQEEKCETCVKCQLMESTLQTPTNASEMEYLNDLPRNVEPQYAKVKQVNDSETHREMSPKTFVRKRKENTVVVNLVNKIDTNVDNISATETAQEISTPNSLLSTTPPKISFDASKESDLTIAKNSITSSKLKLTKTVCDFQSLLLTDDRTETSEELAESNPLQLDAVLSKTDTSLHPPVIKEQSLKEPPKPIELKRPNIRRVREKEKVIEVQQVIEFPLPDLCAAADIERSGFDESLLGGVTDHYVPDLILQGTLAKPVVWEGELRRDLDLTSYLNKTMEAPIQAVAIVGDTNTWEVRVVGRDCGSGGMSSLVGAMLDALPVMRKARVPAHQCLSFLESKLREFCVLSKTLAEMLMSTDFCDIATLTKSLNIDVNDVPLLLAVATTHTPQVAARYGISYR